VVVVKSTLLAAYLLVACLPAGGPALAQSNLYGGLGTIEIPFANGR
jgi:hypothetical protein